MRTNKMRFIGVSAIAAALLASCGGSPTPKFDPENEQHVTSYMMGRNMGTGIKKEMIDDSIQINEAILFMALREAIKGMPARVSDSVLAAADMQLRKTVHEVRGKKRKKIEDDALAAANAFLEENKKKEGVVTTESGLQYVVIKEGSGAKPTIEDKVKVHYHGTLPDNTVFDSSVDRGEPASFAVKGVIQGWTEALQLMSLGSKYRITVPPDLAYGTRGTRGSIGPNAALIFDIELLEIETSEPVAKK